MLRAISAFAKRILPPSLRHTARDLWEDTRDWLDTLAFGLRFIAARTPPPKVLVYFGFALGDDLLCTAVLRELRTRGRDGVLMISDHPELFTGNRDLTSIHPLWARYYRHRSTIAICQRFVRLWGGAFIQPEYAPPTGKDRRRPPARHVIAEMCIRAGVAGPISIKPYIELTEAEKTSGTWAYGHIVVQTSGMAARHPAKNKEWYAERFQGVVDALHQKFSFIQIGSAQDQPLRHVRDLRGTTTLRESAAILWHARLYVGLEGFLMHLARAVECPSVIIFGGRSTPWQLGYVCNVNLYSQLSCAPCWRNNTCDFERQCMKDISVSDVVSAIRQMMERPRNPLAVETVEIVPDSSETQAEPGFAAPPAVLAP